MNNVESTMNTVDHMPYRVSWMFRNGHQWHKDFSTQDDRILFIHTVGLVSHPDIDTVTISHGQDHKDLKRVA